MEFLRGLTMDQIMVYLKQYESLGMLPGILLPLLEAIFPVLPLVVIVLGNAAAYGLWEGFLYSWIGTTLGAIIVFGVVRFFGRRLSKWFFAKFPKTQKFFGRIEKSGFSIVFLISCIPFSPSFLMNVLAGFTRMPFHTFMWAVVLGKAILVFMISFIGHDLQALIHHPAKLIGVVVIIVLLWLLGKWIEKKYSN